MKYERFIQVLIDKGADENLLDECFFLSEEKSYRSFTSAFPTTAVIESMLLWSNLRYWTVHRKSPMQKFLNSITMRNKSCNLSF